jgi:AbrB family looped-hinge helix DNA binding protein
MPCSPIRAWRAIWGRTRAAIDFYAGKTYLTFVTAHTKLSAKGQIVIPKDVRDRLGWPQGSELEVVETAGGIFLRKPRKANKLTADEALAKIRKTYRYDGPALPVEELGFSPDAYRNWLETKR